MNAPGTTFITALKKRYHSGRMPVIPDIKSRSPGEGDLLRGRDPAGLARVLAGAGAPVLSVVTEPDHFGGSGEMLRKIAQATALPVLRKDFISRPEQLRESVDLGAGAVLLIASMLETERLTGLYEEALRLGLEPLVETHNQREILLVKQLNPSMMGINNRNITELETDGGNVKTTEELAVLVGPEVFLISESSISTPLDVQRARAAGARAVLVGTALLKAADPAEMYRRLCEAGEVSQ